MDANLSTAVAAIEAELVRLGVAEGSDGCCVAAEAGLPAGWVRVYDDTANAYGEAGAVLAALRAADPGHDNAWAALRDFPERMDDYVWAPYRPVITELLTSDDERWGTVHEFRTNGGLRYGWAFDEADAEPPTPDFATREEAEESAEYAADGLDD